MKGDSKAIKQAQRLFVWIQSDDFTFNQQLSRSPNRFPKGGVEQFRASDPQFERNSAHSRSEGDLPLRIPPIAELALGSYSETKRQTDDLNLQYKNDYELLRAKTAEQEQIIVFSTTVR